MQNFIDLLWIYALGQGVTDEQDCVSDESPVQSNPLFAGAGSVHALVLICEPDPESQVTEHALQAAQAAQFPSTEKKKRNVYN